MSKGSSGGLNALPPSENKFWEFAETNLHNLMDRKTHIHKFIRVEGVVAECDCGAGIMLTKLTEGIEDLLFLPV